MLREEFRAELGLLRLEGRHAFDQLHLGLALAAELDVVDVGGGEGGDAGALRLRRLHQLDDRIFELVGLADVVVKHASWQPRDESREVAGGDALLVGALRLVRHHPLDREEEDHVHDEVERAEPVHPHLAVADAVARVGRRHKRPRRERGHFGVLLADRELAGVDADGRARLLDRGARERRRDEEERREVAVLLAGAERGKEVRRRHLGQILAADRRGLVDAVGAERVVAAAVGERRRVEPRDAARVAHQVAVDRVGHLRDRDEKHDQEEDGGPELDAEVQRHRDRAAVVGELLVRRPEDGEAVDLQPLLRAVGHRLDVLARRVEPDPHAPLQVHHAPRDRRRALPGLRSEEAEQVDVADDAEVLRDVLREEVERGGLDLTRDRRRLLVRVGAVADLAALQSLALPRGRDAPCFRLVGVDDLLEHHAEKLRRCRR